VVSRWSISGYVRERWGHNVTMEALEGYHMPSIECDVSDDLE